MPEYYKNRSRNYYHSTDIALYYLQSRYYDPEVGRFVNADDVAYLESTGQFLSCNLFVYCRNDPTTRIDFDGKSDQDVTTFACVTILVIGIALLFAVPTGGTSIEFGAIVLSSSEIALSNLTTALVGTAILEHIVFARNNANSKPTSRNQMQQQVESGKAPEQVDRVDPPHTNSPNAQNHIHFKDGTAINQDGTLSHKSRGIPRITNDILDWILRNGWGAPKF